MIGTNPSLLITMNVNDLNYPTKRTDWILKNTTQQYAAIRDSRQCEHPDWM